MVICSFPVQRNYSLSQFWKVKASMHHSVVDGILTIVKIAFQRGRSFPTPRMPALDVSSPKWNVGFDETPGPTNFLDTVNIESSNSDIIRS